MKLKRIVALLLCLITCFALASCETKIGQYYWDVYFPNNIGVKEEKPKVSFDFYIITEFPEDYEDDSVKSQHNSDIATVKDNINLHLEDAYRTTLNIHFLSADNYADEVKNATSGIVLINSETLMNQLVADGALVDLTDFLASDAYEFGTLNVQIASSLLNAAKVATEDGEKLYCIPNNHIAGTYDESIGAYVENSGYTYIAINKEIAYKLQFSKADIEAMDTLEETEPLLEAAKTYWLQVGDGADYSDDSVVKCFEGAYNYERTDAPKTAWTYNVSEYPIVTKAEAYSSAYGILSGTENAERAMEIIYALNTDVTFRNLLQYGVLNNDYDIVDNELENIDSDAVYINIKNTLYKMNVLYTGDVFKAYYTDGWTESDAENGKIQNNDSRYIP